MDSSSIFDSGLEAYREGKLTIAAAYFRQVLSVDPSNWDANFYLAMALAQTSDFKNAEAIFRSIKELCPNAELRQRAEIAAGTLAAMNKKNK